MAYLDSGKINVKDVYKINEYQQALDKLNGREALKVAVKS
jgi:D-arabinitol dehydrogenase (NADP+)